MRATMLLPLLLAACAGGSTDGGDGPDGNDPEEQAVSLTLVSPEDGATYAYEDAIPLHVEAKRNGNPVAIDSASWTIGGWTGTGKETEASGLRSGPATVEVDAVVAGEHYKKSVDITIAEPVQTNWDYAGQLEADVIANIDGLGEFEDHCSAPITFALDSGTLAGSGTCNVFQDYNFDPIPFTMEGTVRGGSVTGDLVMNFDGNEARTPFTGTGNAGDTLSASYDTTHRSSDGSVRIVGTWSASPL